MGDMRVPAHRRIEHDAQELCCFCRLHLPAFDYYVRYGCWLSSAEVDQLSLLSLERCSAFLFPGLKLGNHLALDVVGCSPPLSCQLPIQCSRPRKLWTHVHLRSVVGSWR